MRRAKTKFRPKGNSGGGLKSPPHTPVTSPIVEDFRQVKTPSSLVKSPFGSPTFSPSQSRPVKSNPQTSPDKSTAKTADIFIGQQVDDNDLSLVLVPDTESHISGDIIIPPDASDEACIEEDLFRFKKPASEFSLDEIKSKPKGKKRKNQIDRESVSTKSSRAIAIEKRKKADQNIEKNTADGGQIDRTEVSMSDLIHCGGQTGTHEMDFTKKLRERREAKERATTLSQLTEKTSATKNSDAMSEKASENEESVQKNKIPTVAKPKMRLDENGQIVIDKSSLYQTFQNDSTPLISEEIIEDYEEGFDAINSLSFRRRRIGKRSKNWSSEESDRFYEALTIVGNDFQAISTAFSQRSLSEIKRKFMRENKQNPQNIDQLLKVHESGESNWDLSHLKEKDLQYYIELEKEEDERIRKREERKQKREEKRMNKSMNNNEPKRDKAVSGDADLDEMIPYSLKSEK